jgi:hypothetical protein
LQPTSLSRPSTTTQAQPSAKPESTSARLNLAKNPLFQFKRELGFSLVRGGDGTTDAVRPGGKDAEEGDAIESDSILNLGSLSKRQKNY